MNLTILGLGILIAAGPAPQADRTAAIWSVAEDRIIRQNDIWFKQGDYPRAIQSLRILFGLEPHDYEIATDLGWMLENVENYDSALQVYTQFRKLNPNDPDAPFPEAHFLFQKKQYDKVPPLLEPTLKMGVHPHQNSYRTLAHSYERMKRYADSVRVWQTYLKLAPNDETAKGILQRVKKKMAGGK
jgi:tetratricopeptide (TPR) repeat protein